MRNTTKNYNTPGGDKTVIGGTLEIKEGATVTGLPTGELEPATASTLGGVKVGSGLAVTEDGTLSAPAAASGAAGIVKPGTGLYVNNGALNIQKPIITLERIAHLESDAQLSAVISKVNDILQVLENESMIPPDGEE